MAETKINGNQIYNVKHRFCICGTGTSGSNNAQIESNILPWETENQPFVFTFDFRAPLLSDMKSTQSILISGSQHYGIGFECVMEGLSENKSRICCGLTTTDGSWDLGWSVSEYIVEPLDFFTIRLSYDLSNYKVDYKKNRENTWNNIKTAVSSAKLFCDTKMYIGGTSSGTAFPLWKNAYVDINSFKSINGDTAYFDGIETLKYYLSIGSAANVKEYYEIV